MGLEACDWEKINRCLPRLYRELDAEEHARTLLLILNELVPSDSSALNYFKPPHDLKAVTLPADIATPEQVAKVAQYSHQSPFGAYYVATQDASWKMTADFMPVQDFHKLEIYREALSQLGIKQQIGGILAVVDGVYHIVTIHRTRRGFTEREREILNAMHPHLVTSFLNAMCVSRANRSLTQLQAVMETAPGAYGYFGADARVAWIQARAQQWLNEFFPGEVKRNNSIPQSIARILEASREGGGTPQSLTRSAETEILHAFVSPSALGGWIMRLERKPKVNRLPFSPLPQLTRRENDVLRWMVEGKRNAEIAIILGVSRRTVEKQVQGVLAKLAVENRATAIVRAMELTAAGHAGAQ
jgi:DNA-binding CsgD family transcriptional regulator